MKFFFFFSWQMDIQFLQLCSTHLLFSTEFPLYLCKISLVLMYFMQNPSVCIFLSLFPGTGFILLWFVVPHSLFVFETELN